MKKRVNISSGAEWEEIVGYSRAVRIGNQIEVSGTVSLKDGVPFANGNAYKQTVRILEIIRDAIEKAGGKLENVIRTRIFVTDISKWEEIGRAHGEFFSTIKPATSMVEVSKLIGDDYLLEIEATAVLT
ncbi:MAG TPA: RidA family protein [Cyclobacteriaceae bacterium]|jgi:enamine deaminase RidA (YjgF/YER057c/UK114 family)